MSETPYRADDLSRGSLDDSDPSAAKIIRWLGVGALVLFFSAGLMIGGGYLIGDHFGSAQAGMAVGGFVWFTGVVALLNGG